MITGSLSPVVNHLWQSSLFTGAAWLLSLALRSNRSAIRHGLWLAASVKFLVPFSLLVSLGTQLQWWTASRGSLTPISRVVEQIGAQITQPAGMRFDALPAVNVNTPSNSTVVLLFIIWICGFILSLVLWMRLGLRFRAALRQGTPHDFGLPIPVMISPTRLEPSVFGVRKPVLLLPSGLLERLTPAQLESILAHELCHVRRRDNVTGAIHILVESIFWFYPLVWWIGAQLVRERERACDEEVLLMGHEPSVYAEGILNVCRFQLQSPLICASGATGADLKKRIKSIVNNRGSNKLTSARKLLLGGSGAAAVICPLLIGLLKVPQIGAQTTSEPIINQAPVNVGASNLALAQETKRREHAQSSTGRDPFEAIPTPPEPTRPNVSGPDIKAIEFQGATDLPESMLRAILESRVGGVCDIGTLRRDSQALYNTGRFASVSLETISSSDGVVVRFVLAKRRLIHAIEYKGDDTVTIAEIIERFQKRGINLRAETLYREDELGLAAATIRELSAEKGRRDVTVTPWVEPISPSAVKITFRSEERQ